LFWRQAGPLYLMKELGRLQRIWGGPDDPAYHRDPPRKVLPDCGVIDARCDGRFAWVITRSQQTPQIVVIELQSQRTWEIGPEQGLPVIPTRNTGNAEDFARLWVEPLEPGRAMVVSYFGRLALAMATVDPLHGAKVGVFFEARTKPDPTDLQAWRDSHMAFSPQRVFGFQKTLPPGQMARWVMLTGRRPNERPLLVDPDGRDVRILDSHWEEQFPLIRARVDGDAMYVIHGHHARQDLFRFAMPEFHPELIQSDVPEGDCVPWRSKFLVVGSRCWMLDPQASPERRVRVVTDRVPWGFHSFTQGGQRYAGEANQTSQEAYAAGRVLGLFPCHHYGLLAGVQQAHSNIIFYQAVFSEPQ